MADRFSLVDQAVWSLSTAKPGNGVEQLRDDDVNTYWQSDGCQPHLINIQFHKKMSVAEVGFYLDFKLDESYTPKKICVKAGTTFHDLHEVVTKELEEPNGWVYVNIGDPSGFDERSVIRTHFLQIEVLAMHQNGRDTHIRQVKVFGPRHGAVHRMLYPSAEGKFSSVDFTQFSCIR